MKYRIMEGQFDFPDQEWEQISQDAKDLIKKIFKTNLSQRLTIEQVMKHCWIEKYFQVPPTPFNFFYNLKENGEHWKKFKTK